MALLQCVCKAEWNLTLHEIAAVLLYYRYAPIGFHRDHSNVIFFSFDESVVRNGTVVIHAIS